MRYMRGVTLKTKKHLNLGTEQECQIGCLIHDTPFEEQKYQLHERTTLTKELLVYHCPLCDKEEQSC